MNRIRTLICGLALLSPMAGEAASTQTNGAAEAASNAASALSPVDANFVAQANLGAPFQIASGRIAEKKAATAEIRDYAHLMVVSHIPVVDGLNSILQRKRIVAPPETLLQGAYDSMIASLKSDAGVAFDRDYVEGQVDYQKGNAALFRSRMAPIRASRNLPNAPSLRSKTICSGP
jgi:putative membrane protein